MTDINIKKERAHLSRSVRVVLLNTVAYTCPHIRAAPLTELLSLLSEKYGNFNAINRPHSNNIFIFSS